MAEKAADFAAVAELDEELRALQAEKAALEDTWLELYEAARRLTPVRPCGVRHRRHVERARDGAASSGTRVAVAAALAQQPAERDGVAQRRAARVVVRVDVDVLVVVPGLGRAGPPTRAARARRTARRRSPPPACSRR